MMTLDGLASGLDTKTVIAQLMQVERQPVALLTTQKSRIELVQGVWKEINSRLLTLQNKATALKSPTAFNVQKATSGDPSLVTVTADGTAALGAYEIGVTRLAASQVVASQRTFGDATTALGMTGSFQINGATVSVAAGDSLNAVRDRINATANIGVRAAIVQTAPGSYQLTLTGQKSGAANALTFTDAENALSNLGLVVADAGTGLPKLNTVREATNALVTVNGLTLQSATNTISDAIPGMTINLLKAPAAGDPSPSPLTTTVSVTQDQDSIVAAVKALVDQYNSLTTFIADQRKYDAKNKIAGPLTGDISVTNLVQTLGDRVTDVIASLSGQKLATPGDVGVGTGKWGTPDFGKLVLDEAKLRKALTDDFAGTVAVFTADDGLATRLESFATEFTRPITGILSAKDTALSGQTRDIQSRIDDLNRRLTEREARYQAQFTALEKALSKLKTQGNWLSSQLASMSASN